MSEIPNMPGEVIRLLRAIGARRLHVASTIRCIGIDAGELFQRDGNPRAAAVSSIRFVDRRVVFVFKGGDEVYRSWRGCLASFVSCPAAGTGHVIRHCVADRALGGRLPPSATTRFR